MRSFFGKGDTQQDSKFEQIALFDTQAIEEVEPIKKRPSTRRKRIPTTHQMTMAEGQFPKFIIDRPVRLIELFAGIGAQHQALHNLGIPFESHRVCEWSAKSIIAYEAIHKGFHEDRTIGIPDDEVFKSIQGISMNYNSPMSEAQIRKKGIRWAREILSAMIAINDLKPNVSDIHEEDLGITELEKYIYILTYSFPCQDLSNAGLRAGMEKGASTRSGLLWEVERILNECAAKGTLPQVLLMENVPGVCGKENLGPWNQWLDALEKLGYTNYHKILNAKDFMIPQNRERCFMVSIYGKRSYSFPWRMKAIHPLADFMERSVPERYFLPDNVVDGFVPKEGGDDP